MNNRKKIVLLIVLGFSILAMTIAFAALSTSLRISGTASVPNTSWNIHFRSWAVDTASTVTYGGNTHQNTAVYPSINELTQTVSVANSTKVEGLNIILYQPGDYAKYTFQIINEGTIDASLDNFQKNLTCASGEDCSHISYTVTCSDSVNGINNLLEIGSALPSNGIAYCSLEVKYTDQTNQNSGSAGSVQTYTQSAAHATLDATWSYSQYKNYFEYQTYYGTSSSQPSSKIYLRTNKSTGDKEVCGNFINGTVCMTWSSTGYELSGGYPAAKFSEMENAGATCNSYEFNTACFDSDNDLHCGIGTNGEVYCGILNHECHLQPNTVPYCY